MTINTITDEHGSGDNTAAKEVKRFRYDTAIPQWPSTFTGFSKPLPFSIFLRIVRLLDFLELLKARTLSKNWKNSLQKARNLTFPKVFRLPVEIIQQILALLALGDYNNSRKTCRAWYISSLDVSLLREKLRILGFCDTDPLVKDSKDAIYLSKRLSRECSLGADGSRKCLLRNVVILDMSEVSETPEVHFTVSTCGSHVLLSEGCVVHVYHLQPAAGQWMEFVACIICPRRVLAVSMDTSSRRYSVAILLVGVLFCHLKTLIITSTIRKVEWE
jgi:hypothetical protein